MSGRKIKHLMKGMLVGSLATTALDGTGTVTITWPKGAATTGSQ